MSIKQIASVGVIALCALATSASFSLASTSGHLFDCTGYVGGQRGTLRVVIMAMHRVSTGLARERTRSRHGLVAESPAKPHSRVGVGLARRPHSICQGGQHNGRVLRCRGNSHRRLGKRQLCA